MAKICFPHHSKGKFDSLAEALQTLKEERSDWHDYQLTDIVQYNVCYRDYLRTYGMEALIEHLIEEAPELGNESGALTRLRDWWTRKGRLADYDIQCYHINDKITILGRTFDGLEDIFGHRAIIGKEFFSGFECFTPNEINEYPDVHIGELYENYPTFDSYDIADDRTYQNYIFRTKPIAEGDMTEAAKTTKRSNFCMVHEDIPLHNLPILYYRGEGEYMLLATKKEQASAPEKFSPEGG